ncbi:MAG: site-2 protease family protein [Candidatus Acidiferrales bacterium]
MATTPIELIPKCAACANALPSAALVCPLCHTLVHGAELEGLAAAARQLEEEGQVSTARQAWMRMLPLLPPDSTQAEWTKKKIAALHAEIANAGLTKPSTKNDWAKKFGPLAPLLVLLSKAKVLLALLKFNFLFSFLSFIWIYCLLFGWKFGLGFAVLILIHEMGHYIDIKSRGLPVEMPVFIPGLGAYVKWRALNVTLQTRAYVSLAGPLAGFVSSAACCFIYFQTHDRLWAALAHTGAWLNALNLIPVFMLDGGEAMNALAMWGRIAVLTTCVALWAYLGEGVFILVAAGTGYRLFTKDYPKQPSYAATAYFLAVLCLLALVLKITPGQSLFRTH